MKKDRLKIALISVLLLAGSNVGWTQNDFCSTPPDFGNAFMAADDPNTIEYDNIVSVFHSTMARQKDGSIVIWGEAAGPLGTDVDNNDLPTVISPENGYNYQGSILRYTAGSYNMYGENGQNFGPQFVILTTDGLYVWGQNDIVFPSSLKSTNNFEKLTTITNANAYGLPNGVQPQDVKMMYASYQVLAIVTCTGEVYVIGNSGLQGGGCGSACATSWVQVKKDSNDFLTDIVAVRGTTEALFALSSTASGSKLYTWGKDAYLADGNSAHSVTYATEMTPLPNNETPKMIDMSYGSTVVNGVPLWDITNTYHVLTTNGKVYSVGANTEKQIGDGSDQFTVTERTQWTQPVSLVSDKDIVWISASGRDAEHWYGATINVLSNDGKLFTWGSNAMGMINGNFPPQSNDPQAEGIDPVEQPGGLTADDYIVAVASGGHTSIVVKKCSQKFGYVGHYINGSMGGSANPIYQGTRYTFDYTGKVDFVAAETDVPIVSDTLLSFASCGHPADLTDAIHSVTPDGFTLKWFTDATLTTEVSSPHNIQQSGVFYPVYFDEATSTLLCSSDSVVVQLADCINISGTVFDDANGNTLIDGSEMGTTAGGTMYVYLVDENNVIFDSATVNQDGTYNLVGIPNQDYSAKNYTLYLSQNQYAIGTDITTNPITSTLPSDWVTTGENLGNDLAGVDETPDGALTVAVTNAPIDNANFGIEQLPSSDDKTYTILNPSVDDIIGLDGIGQNPPLFSGSDPEDGTYSGNTGTINNPRGVVISELPDNGELYYNGVLVTQNDVTNQTLFTDPSKFEVKLTGEGYTSVTFEYAYVDAAGKPDPTPNNYTINWSFGLPVELLSFDVRKMGNSVYLAWITASEMNNLGFEVERSSNGETWSALDFVKSRGESGNSQSRLAYRYSDNEPLSGLNYYRLKQVDLDGRYSFSQVKSILFNSNKKIISYPNPVRTELTLVGVTLDQSVVIYNMVGQVVKETSVNKDETFNVDVRSLTPGNYYMTIIENGSVVESLKFVKE